MYFQYQFALRSTRVVESDSGNCVACLASTVDTAAAAAVSRTVTAVGSLCMDEEKYTRQGFSIVQTSAKVDAPGCVNASGKLSRSDKLQQ